MRIGALHRQSRQSFSRDQIEGVWTPRLHAIEDLSVLLVQRPAVRFCFLPDLGGKNLSIPVQLAKLSDQPVDIQVVNILAIFGQAHLGHECVILVMVRNREDRFVEHQRENDIVKPAGHHDIRRCKLG